MADEIARQADSAEKKIIAHAHETTVPASRNLKRFVKFNSPDEEKCDENGFARCLIDSEDGLAKKDSNFYLCSTTYGCNTKWEDVPQERKDEILRKFQTDAGKAERAFDKLGNEIAGDLGEAARRQQANAAQIAEDYRAYYR